MKIFVLCVLITTSLFAMEGCVIRLIRSIENNKEGVEIISIPIVVRSNAVKLCDIQQGCIQEKIIKNNDIPLHLFYGKDPMVIETISPDTGIFDIVKKHESFYLIPISQMRQLIAITPKDSISCIIK